MVKLIATLLTLLVMMLMHGTNSHLHAAQPQVNQGNLSHVAEDKIVVMPFLMGRIESPNAPITKPLSKSLTELTIDGLDLPEGADRIMNRIVNAALKLRFQGRLVLPDRIDNAYQSVLMDPTLDTPRKRAVKLGESLDANLVMVGTVWRYREKSILVDMPEGAASVGFARYIVNVDTGVRRWRGAFDGIQKALSDDVIVGFKQLGMGLRWLSAEELARYGVNSVLRKLPLN